MKRSLPCLLAALALAAAPVIALADVQIRIAVSPTQIAQCGAGQLFTSLGNTGTQPIVARVCFAFRSSTNTFGPLCGRVALAAGVQRNHEFSFVVPAQFPVGSYALVADAVGSDGSTSHSEAPFSVVAGTCVAPNAIQDGGAVLNGMIQSIGATPDGVTPTTPSTWGALKIRYR